MKLGDMYGLEVVLFLLSIWVSGISAYFICLVGRFFRPTALQIDGEIIPDVLSYKAYINTFIMISN